ncbi:cytochrome c3 family protein [Chloroflexota bacterium]
MHRSVRKILRKYGVLLLVLHVLFLVILASSCQGPAGAAGTAGPVGPAGPAGPAGPVGKVGVNAAETCADCHNDTTLIKARQVQYAASKHGSGYTFERNGTDCAACHTAEGFILSLETGSKALEAAVENPSPINCRTCHNIHDTYTEADWALKVSDPVTLSTSGETLDFGKANLCVNCHQPRDSYAVPVVGGGDVSIASTRYGPHHGPQSTMLAGTGGYGEYTGGSTHFDLIEDACVTCHMQSAYGKQAGGHTWSMAYEYHENEVQNTVACVTCHAEADSFDMGGAVTEIQALGEELNSLLIAQNLITSSGSAVPGTYTSAQAGALWNYRMVILEDRSGGVHNPGYAKFLLQTGIDALK